MVHAKTTWLDRDRDRSKERGQVSVLFALCLVVVLVLIAGIAIAGRVAVERARARTAADAVALAGADPAAQQALSDRWAQLGAEVRAATDGAHARAGRAQAQAWVRTGGAAVTRSPALVTIVARAEQLLGGAPVVPLAWGPTNIVLSPDDASRFEVIAAEFGMCAKPVASGAIAFAIC